MYSYRVCLFSVIPCILNMWSLFVPCQPASKRTRFARMCHRPQYKIYFLQNVIIIVAEGYIVGGLPIWHLYNAFAVFISYSLLCLILPLQDQHVADSKHPGLSGVSRSYRPMTHGVGERKRAPSGHGHERISSPSVSLLGLMQQLMM